MLGIYQRIMRSWTEMSNACAGKESPYNYILGAEEAVGLNPVI